jgi:uncharacterized protein YndB with AHSA1/START domain
MKWILMVLAVLIGLVALVALVGLFVPREHRASCRARFRADPEALYAVLADFEGYPAWRAEVKTVRLLEPIGGKPAFVEETNQGPCRYAVELAEPGRKLVLRIAEEDLPYGGSWTFELEADAGGTALTVTEDGFVKNVLFRALARFAFGYHATLERYLEALGRKLGEQVAVERVE